MKSAARGKATSAVEILNISPFGVWLMVEDHEYFAAYHDFPWFEEATIGEILAVELAHPGHLYWPKLDVDLALESLTSPEKFPLVAKRAGSKKKKTKAVS
jgi:hypothetical protein